MGTQVADNLQILWVLAGKTADGWVDKLVVFTINTVPKVDVVHHKASFNIDIRDEIEQRMNRGKYDT